MGYGSHKIAVEIPWREKGGQRRSLQNVGKEVEMNKIYEVSHSAGTPVLTNKQRFFNNLLLATDFSPASDRALGYAASLARHYSSAVYLTHVITLEGYPMVSPEFATSSLEKRHSEAATKFRRLLKSGQLSGVCHTRQ